MAGAFEINKRGIEQMRCELEREFAKHPVRIPLKADTSDVQLPATT